MKKMLMINGSPRSNGSSSEILDIVAETASAKGFACEKIDLGNLKISHCKACMSCKSTGKCATNDDMTALYEKIQGADALAFSVPVYFGMETGLFKNFLDRIYALVDRKDGVRTVRFGKKKIGVIVASCGAPDGNMIYHGMMSHLVMVIRSFGVDDISSGIIPSASPGKIKGTQFMNDVLNSFEFHLSL